MRLSFNHIIVLNTTVQGGSEPSQSDRWQWGGDSDFKRCTGPLYQGVKQLLYSYIFL